jgi:hypothetical protein
MDTITAPPEAPADTAPPPTPPANGNKQEPEPKYGGYTRFEIELEVGLRVGPLYSLPSP